MKVHLVTYATPRFRHRQIFLHASARANRVADATWPFSPAKVIASGFQERCPDLRLNERGSGFWAWKPFIIQRVLDAVPDGDLVFYCDVGRTHPFKLLTPCLPPLLRWMEEKGQSMLPGVGIPWDGPMSMWTKRDAFVLTGMDDPAFHSAAPVQASFSLWRAGSEARSFIGQWMDWCADRRLVSDDASGCGLPELPGFREHRHDQALLSLCCFQRGVEWLDLGLEKPSFDSKHPAEVAKRLGTLPAGSVTGRMVALVANLTERAERCLRRG